MAVTFACEKFVYGLEAIEAYIKMKIPVDWAGDEMFAEDQSKDDFIKNYMRESKQIRIVSEHDDKKPEKFSKEKKGKDRPASAVRNDKKDYKKNPEKREDKTVRTKKDYVDIKPKTAGDKNAHDRNNRRKDVVTDIVNDKSAKNLSLDKRMDYYKERYGEDFKVKREITAVPEKNSKKPSTENSNWN